MITIAVSVEDSEIAEGLRPHAQRGKYGESTQSDEWRYVGAELGAEFLRQHEFDLQDVARRAVEARIAELIPAFATKKGMG